jgi:AraC-like DNA-binding protein
VPALKIRPEEAGRLRLESTKHRGPSPYRLHEVPAVLRPWVASAWSLDAPEGADWGEVVWPTLEADLVVPIGTAYRRNGERVKSAALDGIGLRARRFRHAGRQRLVGVQLRPGGVATLIGSGRARELAGLAAPLDELGLDRLEALQELGEAGPEAAVGELLRGLARLRRGPRPWPALVPALGLLERGLRVREAAARLGVSERTLERGLRDSTGLTPKQAQRLLRFRLAARLLDTSPAEEGHAPALDAGYHDQPHFSRECRALTGRPPGAWWLSASCKRPRD